MKTLILLCGDKRRINKVPQYMNRHPNGSTLLRMSLDSIDVCTYDSVVVTIPEEDERIFDASVFIKSELKDKCNVKVCVLTRDTNSPAESVYGTIIAENIEGEIAIRDSLNSINLCTNPQGNFVVGIDLGRNPMNLDRVHERSFLTLNEQHNVKDIVEKRFCSDIMSVGFYGFKDVIDFIQAFEHITASDYPIEKLYLSHIISYLIGCRRRVFHCLEVTRFEDWKSLRSWEDLQKKHVAIFLDMDAVFETVDIERSDLKTKEMLKRLSKINAYFIFFTTSTGIDKERLQEFFLDNGIKCIDIIDKMPFSEKKKIIDDKESFERMIQIM